MRKWLSKHRNGVKKPVDSRDASHLALEEQNEKTPPAKLATLVAEIKDWQLTHGFLLKLVRLEEPTTVLSQPVSVTVEPTAFSRSLFEEAMDLSAAYNELYMRIASDPGWLFMVLGAVFKEDVLAQTLWQVFQSVLEAGTVQDNVCGIFRSDYMIHRDTTNESCSLKQIELNSFSVAGACHAERAANMHKHLRRFSQPALHPINDSNLPESNNTEQMVQILKQAYQSYRPTTDHPTCVLMIVQPDNFNIADERPLEYGLFDKEIPCYRCIWQEVLNHTALEDDRTLTFYRGELRFEVSLVYYRAGYEAREYDAIGTDIRLRLELSRAIKCPDVLTHLTTFKAVQAALAAPGAVERFLPTEKARTIRETFVPILPLSNPEAIEIAKDRLKVEGYVLKVNREGGGNGVFGADIPDFVSSLAKTQYGNYILMALVRPPERQGILLTSTDLYEGPVVSELGILGTCLWKRGLPGLGVSEILHNAEAGWTFKTKPAHVNEMNVVKGYGCFDCPRLE